MAQKVMKIIKLQIPAGKANPAPPVGSALGQHGVNIQDFCNQFNNKTKEMGDTLIPVVISVYEDRSFSFITKMPPASTLIKKVLSLKKGSGTPQKDKVSNISQAQLREVAEKKMEDLNANDIEHAMNIIAGTARSMGVTVDE
ncbi:MAG TPA: 50S ribosomal protein L11 [Thermodesulforhabdus norvegica]|uniref:Large ribosomal subunit protein uL11 n=1 Tax=Thermodesulforhabdus norvegica TaxID=39841 RepID=A0A7C1ALC8_9BACT|nr:50S ribosomal protein L11 [Thermodesulforhabdus norvegica]